MSMAFVSVIRFVNDVECVCVCRSLNTSGETRKKETLSLLEQLLECRRLSEHQLVKTQFIPPPRPNRLWLYFLTLITGRGPYGSWYWPLLDQYLDPGHDLDLDLDQCLSLGQYLNLDQISKRYSRRQTNCEMEHERNIQELWQQNIKGLKMKYFSLNILVCFPLY